MYAPYIFLNKTNKCQIWYKSIRQMKIDAFIGDFIVSYKLMRQQIGKNYANSICPVCSRYGVCIRKQF